MSTTYENVVKSFNNDLFLPKRNKYVNDKFDFNIEQKYNNDNEKFKPNGFWFGCWNSWQKWTSNEMPNLYNQYIKVLSISFKHNVTTDILNSDPNKILVISTLNDFDTFTKKYHIIDHIIDWGLVSQHYAGIEICRDDPDDPYFHERRYTDMWWYSWDAASGCIWNLKPVIKSVDFLCNKEEIKIK